MTDWLSSAIDRVGQQRNLQEQQATATYFAMRRAQDADAAKAAQSNDLARWSGLPADTVQRNMGQVEDARQTQWDGHVISTAKHMQPWLTDPRNSAAAQGDLDNLGALSYWLGPTAGTDTLGDGQIHLRPSYLDAMRPQSSRDLLRSARADTVTEQQRLARVEANRPKSSAGSWWTGTSVESVEGFKRMYYGAMQFYADALGAKNVAEEYNPSIAASLERTRAYHPTDLSTTGEAVYGGITSLEQMLPAAIAGFFTGGATVPLTIAGLTTGTQAYAETRARGGTANEALASGTLQGGIEVGTEMLPFHYLYTGLAKRPTLRTAAHFLGSEMLGEQLATLGQDAVDTAIANPTATWSQYWADRPKQAYNTAIATLMASTALGGGAAAFSRMHGPIDAFGEAVTATAGAHFIDQLMSSAEASSLRKNDPEGFRQFVDLHSAQTPMEHMYIPAEAVRSMFQSEGRDYHTDTFWGPYADQVDEAAKHGGDVVMPVADAVTGLAGSKQWETLRDSVRLSPGGVSLAEARSIQQSYSDLMHDRGAEFSQQMSEALHEAAPATRVYDTVFDQTRQAGFSVRAARAYADLFASRYQARAEQRGSDAWSVFNESLGGITSDVPDTIRRYNATDQTDVLIHAMRNGEQAPSDRLTKGPSLLEFIASRGGVEDPGGDLKSMGAEEWHRQAPFRRRLIRAAPEGSATLPGLSAAPRVNTPDDVARAAWEAGYFPNQSTQPAVDDLLQAVRQELHGQPIHALEGGRATGETDRELRSAAEDLRGWLESRGIDSTTASNEEIKSALAEREQEIAKQYAQRVEPVMRPWNEPPPGMSDKVFHHNGPVNLPLGRPTAGPDVSYFGDRDFSEAIGTEFGPWRYTYWVPQAVVDKMVDLDTVEGNKFAALAASLAFPEDKAFADGLAKQDPDAWAEFYEIWADGSLLAPALREAGYVGAHYRAENVLLAEGVAQLVDRRDGPDDGTVSFYQTQPEHPPFYSALRRAVETVGATKAPAAQWKGTLQNASGVKAEELEWSGLTDWLDAQQGSISRADIQAFLDQGGIRVDEVVLGDFDPKAVKTLADSLMEAEAAKRAHEFIDKYGEDPFDRDVNVGNIEEATDPDNGEKTWTFDGVEYGSWDEAEDARIDAIGDVTMRLEQDEYERALDAARQQVEAAEDEWLDKAKEQLGAVTQFSDWTSTGQATPTYRELLITLPVATGRNPRTAPETHWEQPGVVAHARFQEKRDALDRPVLFVEEVQSDWHQKGRDQGYAQPVAVEKIVAAGDQLERAQAAHGDANMAVIRYARELAAYSYPEQNYDLQATNALAALMRLQVDLSGASPSGSYAQQVAETHRPLEVVARIRELVSAVSAAKLRVNETRQIYANLSRQQSGVPDAPFKATWPALVMKRMIRWAADNGYHSVAWTTGKQQADRYSLEHGLGGSVNIRATMAQGDGEQGFIVTPADSVVEDMMIERYGLEEHGGANGRGINMSADQVHEVFGSDLGGRLIELAKAGRVGQDQTLKGDDLRIGGDGMRAFYDRNLVNITNGLIKKYGAKVGPMDVAMEDRETVMRRVEVLRREADYYARSGLDAQAEGLYRQATELSQSTKEQQWGFEVTPKLAEAARSGFALFQGGETKARGRIDFGTDGKAMIRLFEGRDLSTLLHESTHLWLEELRADANRPDAPQQVKDDWATVRGWFEGNGHQFSPGGEIPVEAHEMFARAGERYFMEGKAPTSALQSAFAAFRSWLLRIYKVVANLHTPLDDNVRKVLDRMVATQSAIDQETRSPEEALLFKDAASAGMTAEEYAAYRSSAEHARTASFDALLYRTMEGLRRERLKAWKEQRQGVRSEMEKAVKVRPEFRALALLRGRGGERVPLSRQAVVAEYGSDALSLLPRGVPPTIVEEGGVHPDVLAEMSGFRTGAEMMPMLMGLQARQEQLRAAGSHRSVFQEAVDQATDQAMRERHGDPFSDGTLEEAALAAIHNNQRAEVIASEARALSRRTTRPGDHVPTPWQLARDWAQRQVRGGLVREQATAGALARHRRNEERAARAAEAALVAGNVDEAFKQKQSQLYNHALWREAKEAKDEVEAIVKRLGKFAKARKIGSIDPEYLDRIHELLEAYDFRMRSDRALAERQSFAAWAAAREEAGEEVVVPARLADVGKVNFTHLTVDDLTGLDDAVQSVAHLGRRKNKLLVAKEERELAELVNEAVAGAAEQPSLPTTNERNPQPTLRSRVRGLDALLVKVEALADQLDGGNPNGVFNRLLVQGSNEAANHKDRLVDRVLKPLAELYNKMPRDQQRRMHERVTVPELVTRDRESGVEGPTVYTRMELLAVALNTGNESNLSKMLRGESRIVSEANAWTADKVAAVLDRELTEADWQFVSSVWKQIDLLWPDIVRAEKEITGVTPEKVEPRIVQTKFGEIHGGYYPVVYDPTRSTMAEANYEDDASKMLGQMGRSVATPKGHTISRTEAAAPLLLSVEAVLVNHVNRATTRIAYGRFVRDTLKFLAQPKVREVIETKAGREYYKQLKPWLQRQVNDASLDTKQLAALDRVMRQFRINATMVGLGFRTTTMMAQAAGLTNSAAQIGAKWVGVGIGEMARMASRGQLQDFVFTRSEEMAHRMQTFDRDVRTTFKDMAGNAGRFDKLRAMAYWGIGTIQLYVVDMPTWLGAYRKAVSEDMTEDQAIAFADKAVRMSQGAGRAKDLSAIQGGPEMAQTLTMFYSYFNVLYNKQRELVLDARRGDYRKAAMTTAWVMMLAPLASALLTGDWPDDESEEGWFHWAMRKMFFGLWASLPVIRDVMGYAEQHLIGHQTPPPTAPVFRAFTETGRPLSDAMKVSTGDEPSSRWLQNVITVPGYFLGLPTGQLGSTVQYLHDLKTGDQKPKGVGDVVLGVTKGPQRAQER